MLTLFSSELFFKFVSFLLYLTEVKMLKCAMLGAFTVPVFAAMLRKVNFKHGTKRKLRWRNIRKRNIRAKVPAFFLD